MKDPHLDNTWYDYNEEIEEPSAPTDNYFGLTTQPQKEVLNIDIKTVDQGMELLKETIVKTKRIKKVKKNKQDKSLNRTKTMNVEEIEVEANAITIFDNDELSQLVKKKQMTVIVEKEENL